MIDSIKLRHQVTAAWWDELRGVWALKVLDLRTGLEFDDEANFLVNACGILKCVAPPGNLVRTDFQVLTDRIATGNGLR